MKKLIVSIALVIPALAQAADVPRSEWIKRPAAIRDLHLKFHEPARNFSVQRNYQNGGFTWIDGSTLRGGTISRTEDIQITGKLQNNIP